MDSNAAQTAEWNGPAVEGWLAHGDAIDRFIAPLTEALLDRLAPVTGERILDVGCGAGATTVAIAARVAPDGEAVGVDISRPLLEAARRRGEESGAPVRFLEADAQQAPLGGPFDAASSRMGVMFFDDPSAAFTNIAAELRPAGRIVFASWQAPQANPWILVPLLAAAAHLPVPPPGPPDAPGPFSLAEPDRIRDLLRSAGLTDVDVEPVMIDDPLPPAERYAEIVLSIVPPLAEGMAHADEGTRARTREAVVAALEPHGDDTGVRLPRASWLVSARRS